MLLQWGDFTLHSGDKSWWRIDCDAFIDSELQILARLIHERVLSFSDVICPNSHPGSAAIKLRSILKNYTASIPDIEKQTEGNHSRRLLIVDDVLTTGNSMEQSKRHVSGFHYPIIGAVIFARGQCPEWITPLFRFSDNEVNH